MRSTWVRPGGPLFPDRTKAKAWALDGFIWNANDKTIKPQTPKGASPVLDPMRAEGWKIGINRNTHNEEWPDSPTDAAQFAAKMSQDITDLNQNGKQCFVVFDGEMHNADWNLGVLQEFYRLRNGRYLYWTMEPKQFGPGWVTPALISWINRCPLLWIVIQLYRSQMQPVSERVCVDQAIAAGVAPGKILAYYDRYEEDLNGIVYDYENAT